jgi:multidrug efflux pump subunit AcrB
MLPTRTTTPLPVALARRPERRPAPALRTRQIRRATPAATPERRLLSASAIMLAIYGGLIGLTYFQFGRTPSGFIAPLDRAYFINVVTLPPGASLERTDAVIREASKLLLSRPGVAHAVTFAGFDGATSTNAPNTGVIFAALKPFEERVKEGLSGDMILSDLRRQMQALRAAFILVLPPPSVPGIGTGGGFTLYVQDRAGGGARALEKASSKRPWASCHIKEVGGTKMYRFQQRLDGERRDRGEKVVVGRRQNVVPLTFEGTKALGIPR